jgi:hypothetical protein
VSVWRGEGVRGRGAGRCWQGTISPPIVARDSAPPAQQHSSRARSRFSQVYSSRRLMRFRRVIRRGRIVEGWPPPSSLELDRRSDRPDVNQLDLDSADALADGLASPAVDSTKEPARKRHPADGTVAFEIERRRPACHRRALSQHGVRLLARPDQVGRLVERRDGVSASRLATGTGEADAPAIFADRRSRLGHRKPAGVSGWDSVGRVARGHARRWPQVVTMACVGGQRQTGQSAHGRQAKQVVNRPCR